MFEQRAANRTQAPIIHRRCEDSGPGNVEWETTVRPQATNAASPREGGTSEVHRPQHSQQAAASTPASSRVDFSDLAFTRSVAPMVCEFLTIDRKVRLSARELNDDSPRRSSMRTVMFCTEESDSMRTTLVCFAWFTFWIYKSSLVEGQQ